MCTLSDGRAQTCGFTVTDSDGQTWEIPGELKRTQFSCTIPHILPEKTYYWTAFARARDGEVRSKEQSFMRAILKEDPIPVKDPAFLTYLLSNYDWDANGEISFAEAERITTVSLSPSNAFNLQSLSGIEYMPNLEVIDCPGDWYDSGNKSDPIDSQYYYIGPYKDNWETVWGPIGTLREVDVSHNPKLRILHLEKNSALGAVMGALDLSGNPALEDLNLGFTWLSYPDISHHSALRFIDLNHLPGAMPDFSHLPELRELHVDFPQDEKNCATCHIDVSGSPLLEKLFIPNAAGMLSDLSCNPLLRELNIGYCPVGQTIDFSVLAKLEVLQINDNDLDSLDLSGNPRLRFLTCYGNWLTALDISGNPLLTYLDCAPMKDGGGNNLLKAIYVSPSQRISEESWFEDGELIPPEAQIYFRGGTVPTDPADPRIGTLVDAGGKGILFSIDPDGQTGWLVSAGEVFQRPWQDALEWCRKYGDGTWDMPDIEQLNQIHLVFETINKTLTEEGLTPLCTRNYCYWSRSSYEKDPNYRYRMRLWDGLTLCYGSDEHISSTMNYTRAVKQIPLSLLQD